MDDFTGKHVVITGAARGIGAAIAQAFAERGATLSLMGRDMTRLTQKSDELAALTTTRAIQIDVTNEISVREAFARARDAHGAIDMLIANAGIAESAPLKRTDIAMWQRIMDTNLTGVFLCMREVAAEMATRNSGRIVTIASVAGLAGAPYITAYCASKHGVIGLTRALAMELAKSGVTVNAVCPGYTETDMVTIAIQNIMQKTSRSESEARAELAAKNPQARLVQPEEVANTTLWLCSAGASAITGQAISVTGGEYMN
jgi:NAD(P)-dependent dehydrogenase (short-subunit alcohol dehydrogenase family)